MSRSLALILSFLILFPTFCSRVLAEDHGSSSSTDDDAITATPRIPAAMIILQQADRRPINATTMPPSDRSRTTSEKIADLRKEQSSLMGEEILSPGCILRVCNRLRAISAELNELHSLDLLSADPSRREAYLSALPKDERKALLDYSQKKVAQFIAADRAGLQAAGRLEKDYQDIVDRLGKFSSAQPTQPGPRVASHGIRKDDRGKWIVDDRKALEQALNSSDPTVLKSLEGLGISPSRLPAGKVFKLSDDIFLEKTASNKIALYSPSELLAHRLSEANEKIRAAGAEAKLAADGKGLELKLNEPEKFQAGVLSDPVLRSTLQSLSPDWSRSLFRQSLTNEAYNGRLQAKSETLDPIEEEAISSRIAGAVRDAEAGKLPQARFPRSIDSALRTLAHAHDFESSFGNEKPAPEDALALAKARGLAYDQLAKEPVVATPRGRLSLEAQDALQSIRDRALQLSEDIDNRLGEVSKLHPEETLQDNNPVKYINVNERGLEAYSLAIKGERKDDLPIDELIRRASKASAFAYDTSDLSWDPRSWLKGFGKTNSYGEVLDARLGQLLTIAKQVELLGGDKAFAQKIRDTAVKIGDAYAKGKVGEAENYAFEAKKAIATAIISVGTLGVTSALAGTLKVAEGSFQLATAAQATEASVAGLTGSAVVRKGIQTVAVHGLVGGTVGAGLDLSTQFAEHADDLVAGVPAVSPPSSGGSAPPSLKDRALRTGKAFVTGAGIGAALAYAPQFAKDVFFAKVISDSSQSAGHSFASGRYFTGAAESLGALAPEFFTKATKALSARKATNAGSTTQGTGSPELPATTADPFTQKAADLAVASQSGLKITLHEIGAGQRVAESVINQGGQIRARSLVKIEASDALAGKPKPEPSIGDYSSQDRAAQLLAIEKAEPGSLILTLPAQTTRGNGKAGVAARFTSKTGETIDVNFSLRLADATTSEQQLTLGKIGLNLLHALGVEGKGNKLAPSDILQGTTASIDRYSVKGKGQEITPSEASSQQLDLLNQGHADGVVFDRDGNPVAARDVLETPKEGPPPTVTSLSLSESELARGALEPKFQAAIAKTKQEGAPLLVVKEGGPTPERFLEDLNQTSRKPRAPQAAGEAPLARTPEEKAVEINTARKLILSNVDVGGKNSVAKLFHDARNVSSVFANEYFPSEAAAPKIEGTLSPGEKLLSPSEQSLLLRTRDSFDQINSPRNEFAAASLGNTSAESGGNVVGTLAVEFRATKAGTRDSELIRYSFPNDGTAYSNIGKLAINAIYAKTRPELGPESLGDGIHGEGKFSRVTVEEPSSSAVESTPGSSSPMDIARSVLSNAAAQAKEFLELGEKKFRELREKSPEDGVSIQASEGDWIEFLNKAQETNEEILSQNPEPFRRAIEEGNPHALWLQELGARVTPDGKVEFPPIKKILGALENQLREAIDRGEISEADTIRPARFFTQPGPKGEKEYIAVPLGEAIPEGATPVHGIVPLPRSLELLAQGYFPLGEPEGIVQRRGQPSPLTATFHDLAHFSAFYEDFALMKEMRQAARQLVADRAFYREIPSIRREFAFTGEDVQKLRQQGLLPENLKRETSGLTDSAAADLINRQPAQDRLDLQATVIQAGLRGRKADNSLRPLNDRALAAVRFTLFLENGFEIPRESSKALFERLKSEGSLPVAANEEYGGRHRLRYQEVRDHLERISSMEKEPALASELQKLVDFYKDANRPVGGMPRDIYQAEVRKHEEPSGFGYYFTPEYFTFRAEQLIKRVGEPHQTSLRPELLDLIARMEVIGVEAGRLTAKQWLADITRLKFDPSSETGQFFAGTGAFPKDLYYYAHGGSLPSGGVASAKEGLANASLTPTRAMTSAIEN